MVIRIFILLYICLTSLQAHCSSFVKVEGRSVVFFNTSGTPIKKVSLGKPVKKILCLTDDRVALVTDEAFFITDTKGHLYQKKEIPTDLSFVDLIENKVIYKNNHQFILYTISKKGSISRSVVMVPVDEKPIFVSFDHLGQAVVFTRQHLRLAKQSFEIVPLALDKTKLVYLDVKSGEIFRADHHFYKNSQKTFSGHLYDASLLAMAFQKMQTQQIEKILRRFGYDTLAPQAAAVYLDKFQNHEKGVQRLKDYTNDRIIFESLMQLGWIKVPNLGIYELTDKKTLQTKINSFLSSGLNRFVSMGAKVNAVVKYPNYPDKSVIVEVKVATQTFFSLELHSQCELLSEKKITEQQTIGFFIPVAEAERQYRLRDYKCRILQHPLKIEKHLTDTLNKFTHIEDFNITAQWEMYQKEFVKELSRTPTLFGQLLLQSSKNKSSASCQTIHTECLQGCKPKENEMRFLPFSASDRAKCRDYCNSADYYCKKGNRKKLIQNYCHAQCIGYSKEMHGLSDSDLDTCQRKCIDSYH